jgi:hypothetical protein
MAKSKKFDTHQLSYVTAKKAAHTETQLAYELQDSNMNCSVYGARLIMPLEDAEKRFGAPVFVFVDGTEKARLPKTKNQDRFSHVMAKKAAHRKTQLAYELVASDEIVDFYRVRSIMRLEEEDSEFRAPVFVFVDGKHKARAGTTAPVDMELGKVGRA